MKYLRMYESKNGGTVDIHPLHGADELPNNLIAACVIADHGHIVELLPLFPPAEVEARQQWLSDVVGTKNPDVRIDTNIIGDIKTPDISIAVKKSTINRCIYTCARQKVAIAIINLLNREYVIQDIKKGIIGALQPGRNKTIEEVWVITTKGNLFKAKRAMVFDESIYDELNLL